MRTETVTYEADGLHFKSELFVEAGTEPKPGVLVFPEAFGLSEHARTRAEGLAKLGYAALACDIHGEGRLVTDLGEALGLTVVPMLVGYTVVAVQHASDPDRHGPGGGVENFVPSIFTGTGVTKPGPQYIW